MVEIPDLPDVGGWFLRNGVSLGLIFIFIAVLLGTLGILFSSGGTV